MHYSDEINRLKKEKNAVILAHYYVPGELQDAADLVGDSFALAKAAAATTADIICFCGVHFMGESAKILNPGKKVLMPDRSAGCPMADMATPEQLLEAKELYPDAAIVTYINSSANIKVLSDVCVTSSNAVGIVKKLKEPRIYFVPDRNLGAYVASQIPEKEVLLHSGYCPIHENITGQELRRLAEEYPDAPILVHPESHPDAVALATVVGSTKALLDAVGKMDAADFIIGTESGIEHQMKKVKPRARFHFPTARPLCEDMKKNTLESLYLCLRDETGEIELSPEVIEKAYRPLKRMMELG
jgi:quinolinate synthase